MQWITRANVLLNDANLSVSHHPHLHTLIAHNLLFGKLVVEGYRGSHELGDIVRHEASVVELPGVPLGQHEGLAHRSVFGNMAEVGTRILSIVAARTEDEPTTVGTPRMHALGIGAVGFGHRTALARLQIHQPKVGLGMPDVEIAVVGHRVAKEATIVGRPGIDGTLSQGFAVDQCIYFCTIGSRIGVEGDAAEAVVHLLEFGRIVLRTGHAEIECTTVRRKGREGFEGRISLQCLTHKQLVIRDVIDLHIAGKVHHLDDLMATHVEALTRVVGAVGDITARGMPIGIDAEAQCLLGLGVIGLHLAILTGMGNQRSTMIATYMKAHIARIALQIAVTVDTATELRVFDQGTFTAVGEPRLVDAHLGIGLVSWFDETIGDEWVDLVA